MYVFTMLSLSIFLILSSLGTMKGFLQKAKAELQGAIQRDGGPGHPGGHFGSSPPQSQRHDRPSWPHQPSGPGHHQPQTISDPTPVDILRYRYHHGTNLGSVYVIERWLQPSRFPDGAGGSSELAAVKAWVDKIGLEATKQKFEEQWANAISDRAIGWLANQAKGTTVSHPRRVGGAFRVRLAGSLSRRRLLNPPVLIPPRLSPQVRNGRTRSC